ncbi:MAG: bifunctional methylenetetrahydrofolate dehydrogenase/methenyltetrahydrofolate cyclohydrolase FolD [Flavobacteriales bacterium]
MSLLDGKKLSKKIKEEIKVSVEKIVREGKRPPHLAAILVGKDGASQTYVNHKVKSCEEVGFESTLVRLSEKTTEEELLEEIEKLNQNIEIDGFIVQLPLPKNIDQDKVIGAINPKKDVDGFHPENFGRMALELPSFLPATPYGIMMLLERNNVDTQGKHTVVIGRSKIVGSPMSILMAQRHKTGNSTVTLTHSATQNLAEFTRKADIIVVALGIPNFLKGDMVKEGVVVIDVGITRIEDQAKKNGFRLVGDVNYEEVAPKASWITPVPGGVGPMTVTMLMKNTLLAYERFS